MRRYSEAPALRRLAVLVEAHLLGPQDDDDVSRDVLTFRAADERGLGALTTKDIASALTAQGLNVPDDLDEIVDAMDLDQSGEVNLVEFVAATMDPKLFCEPRLCKAAFRVLDSDSDGYVPLSDLPLIYLPLSYLPLPASLAQSLYYSLLSTLSPSRTDHLSSLSQWSLALFSHSPHQLTRPFPLFN